MNAGTVALACSGTVTTELAMAGCPMIVGYRMSRPTFEIVKRLIRTPFAVLLNIAMGRMVVPELMQDAMTPEALAEAAGALLDDPLARARQIAEQDEALKKMGRGGPDPSELAAEVIVGMLAEG
jgi:lipid-A-disaccharide synthase